MTYGVGESSQRIQRLREQYFRHRPAVCIEKALALTEVFKETEGEPTIIRRGKAFKKTCETKTVVIQPGELIVGMPAHKPRAGIFCPEVAWQWLNEELDTISTRSQDPYEITDEDKETLREVIFPYWKGKSVYEHWMSQVPAETKEISVKTGIIDVEIKTQSGPGEIAPGYEDVLKRGFNGIKRDAEGELRRLDYTSPEHIDRINFLKAVILCCDGISALAARYASQARELASKEGDTKRRTELETIAEICDWVPANPPRSFWEALQSLWFAQIGCHIEANGPSYSPGRFDQYMFSFYERDVSEGRLTKQRALELIECLWIKFAESTWFLSKNAAMYFAGYQPYQNICVGGLTRDGRDATNELSYLCVQATMDVKLHSPSLSVRLHKKTPEDLLVKVCELVKLGTGFPAIHCDETTIKMMLLKGAIIEDARNYCEVGCVEPNVPGKMSQWSDGGHYNYGAAMEFALTNGISLMNNKRRLGLETGDPRTFETFDQLKQAVKDQLAYFIKHIAIACHITERSHAELCPYPYMSSMVEDCVKRGKDITVGGARYSIGPAFIGTGIADLANSLAAIKRLVYEDKMATMDELCNAIMTNFEGREDLRLMLWNKGPKWGNDDDYVDTFAREMTDYAYGQISTYRSYRGAPFISGLYPVASHVPHGLVVAALPYGRRAGLPLADGCSPKGGTDRKGPTAVLKSVSKINHEVHVAGTLLNMKLDPQSFKEEEGLRRLAALLRTFVDLGIYHIQFNVVTAETLKAAQQNPDEYRSLIVRVAGYSAYFVELCPEIQNDIIERTLHTI
jgi:choline trimethylamine-lyase